MNASTHGFPEHNSAACLSSHSAAPVLCLSQISDAHVPGYPHKLINVLKSHCSLIKTLKTEWQNMKGLFQRGSAELK